MANQKFHQHLLRTKKYQLVIKYFDQRVTCHYRHHQGKWFFVALQIKMFKIKKFIRFQFRLLVLMHLMRYHHLQLLVQRGRMPATKELRNQIVRHQHLM